MPLRLDLVYHYLGGQFAGWFFKTMGAETVDNAVVSIGLMVFKESTDAYFDVLDLLFGIAGWCTAVL